jgi:hypothetical protein
LTREIEGYISAFKRAWLREKTDWIRSNEERNSKIISSSSSGNDRRPVGSIIRRFLIMINKVKTITCRC